MRYDVVGEAECWARTGKAPISTRWVDIHKGGDAYRSRWVARGFKTTKTGEFFASTPPPHWEVVKLRVSILASHGGGGQAHVDMGRERRNQAEEGRIWMGRRRTGCTDVGT